MGFFNIFNKEKQDIGIVASDLFKESKEADIIKKNCDNCSLQEICRIKQENDNSLCSLVEVQEQFDFNKPSIMLVDDNMGVLSFLEDDLNELNEKELIDLSKFNILKFSTPYAAFQLIETMKVYGGLNVKYGIFDITLGGGLYNEKDGNVVLDGVDAVISTKVYNPEMKFLFFTGNKLNPYIKKNKEIIDKFENFNGDDIQKYILYKTALSPEDRKRYISDFLQS